MGNTKSDCEKGSREDNLTATDCPPPRVCQTLVPPSTPKKQPKLEKLVVPRGSDCEKGSRENHLTATDGPPPRVFQTLVPPYTPKMPRLKNLSTPRGLIMYILLGFGDPNSMSTTSNPKVKLISVVDELLKITKKG